ncbi:MAG: hypothetical protein ACRDTA_04280 [Pseudonocardiaceae bacterium]
MPQRLPVRGGFLARTDVLVAVVEDVDQRHGMSSGCTGEWE